MNFFKDITEISLRNKALKHFDKVTFISNNLRILKYYLRFYNQSVSNNFKKLTNKNSIYSGNEIKKGQKNFREDGNFI